MSDSAEKIEKARKIEVKVDKMTFFCRRLTWLEWAKIRNGQVDSYDALITFSLVDGWENVREKDLFLGGGKDQLDFNRQTFNTAIVDMAKAYEAIVSAVIKETNKFFEKKDELEKNLQAGSTKAS